MFPSFTPMQCMGFLLSGGDEVIGIDSATQGETEHIEKAVLGLGGKVDCWFFTHAHMDHIQGFTELLRRGKIQVNSVCYKFPSIEYIGQAEKNDPRQVPTVKEFEAEIETHGIKVIRPEKGVKMNVGHFGITPLSDGNAVGERLNSSSVVYRVDTSGKSILFLGDMDWVAEDKILQEFRKEIKCPVVQVAHHGQHGVTEKFYKAVQPEVALWCTPEWLWNNDVGTGFDKGPFATLETRGWFEKLGTVNYRAEGKIIILD